MRALQSNQIYFASFMSLTFGTSFIFTKESNMQNVFLISFIQRFDLNLSLESSISIHLFWSLWFYFRGFRFCLHKMFRYVVFVQPEKNVCEKFLIKSNYKKKICAISTWKISKKQFATFDSYVKMKLVPNVRYKRRKANLVIQRSLTYSTTSISKLKTL